MKRNPTLQGNYGPNMNAFRSVSVKLWTSKNLTRMGTGTRMHTRTWTAEVSRVAVCSRTENKKSFGSVFNFSEKQLFIKKT